MYEIKGKNNVLTVFRVLASLLVKCKPVNAEKTVASKFVACNSSLSSMDDFKQEPVERLPLKRDYNYTVFTDPSFSAPCRLLYYLWSGKPASTEQEQHILELSQNDGTRSILLSNCFLCTAQIRAVCVK